MDKHNSKTQVQRIIEYLQEHGSITTLDAFRDLGVARLSARIYNIRHMGYAIDEDWICVENRFGQKCRVVRYKLTEEK